MENLQFWIKYTDKKPRFEEVLDFARSQVDLIGSNIHRDSAFWKKDPELFIASFPYPREFQRAFPTCVSTIEERMSGTTWNRNREEWKETERFASMA